MPANPWRVAGIRIGLCAVLLSAAPLTAVAPRQLAAPDDQAIRTQIEARLVEKGFIGLSVEVHSHVATVTGSVASLWSRQQVIEQVRKVRNVADVVSMLTIGPGESDKAMALEIADEIGASLQYTIFDDITIQVGHGVAVLTGHVVNGATTREATSIASRVPGVQQVVGRIETLPPSMSDDQLRYAIASSIYGALLPQYVNARSGPVHIIVELGHVTLTGVVSSHTDRRLAEAFARQVFGVMSVENRIAVEQED